MADDPATNSLVLCVLDGHGEHGDYVSAWFRDQLVAEMFNHPSWATNLNVAVADAIAAHVAVNGTGGATDAASAATWAADHDTQ